MQPATFAAIKAMLTTLFASWRLSQKTADNWAEIASLSCQKAADSFLIDWNIQSVQAAVSTIHAAMSNGLDHAYLRQPKKQRALTRCLQRAFLHHYLNDRGLGCLEIDDLYEFHTVRCTPGKAGMTLRLTGHGEEDCSIVLNWGQVSALAHITKEFLLGEEPYGPGFVTDLRHDRRFKVAIEPDNNLDSAMYWQLALSFEQLNGGTVNRQQVYPNEDNCQLLLDFIDYHNRRLFGPDK